MKHKIRRTAGSACILLLLVLAAILWRMPERTAGNGEGSATGRYAVRVLREMYGDSYVEELADIEKAAADPAPEVYLRENSAFVIDEGTIEEKVQEAVLGLESTAVQSQITVEQLLDESREYESLDDYREQKRRQYVEFVKERLAVYEAAGDRHITVSTAEYRELLPEYAAAFGYADTEQFQQECDRDSIACEMLYDKTIRSLR